MPDVLPRAGDLQARQLAAVQGHGRSPIAPHLKWRRGRGPTGHHRHALTDFVGCTLLQTENALPATGLSAPWARVVERAFEVACVGLKSGRLKPQPRDTTSGSDFNDQDDRRQFGTCPVRGDASV